VKRVPSASVDVIRIVPPCDSTICWLM
jgi:hypothetical protein